MHDKTELISPIRLIEGNKALRSLIVDLASNTDSLYRGKE